jgi:hypothetical protein
MTASSYIDHNYCSQSARLKMKLQNYSNCAAKAFRRTVFRPYSTSTALHSSFPDSPILSRSRPSNLISLSREAKRSFSTSLRWNAHAQPVRGADAYIQSGVVDKAKNLVDVKKVLLISSGGLVIGQAGEFDCRSSQVYLQFFNNTSCRLWKPGFEGPP